MTLVYKSQPPSAGGAPKALAVLLHGLGADGNDLIGLAPHWAPALPHVEFIAPDAPERCDMAPYGYQWFSVQDRSPGVRAAGVARAAATLDRFLDDLLAARHLAPERMALVGFSQGTMMALHVALRRPSPVAGVVGYSGRLLAGADLPAAVRSRPPVLLVHGDEDAVVPFESLAEAAAGLERAGVAVETLICPGVGHSIDEAGLQRGGEFLTGRLKHYA